MQAAQQVVKAILLVGLIAALTACGGGGGSDDPAPPAPSDTTPSSFSFTAVDGVEPGATVTSNAITISGITTAAPISISGGEYAIDGGTFTSAAGNVSNGETVTVRLTAANATNTPVEATLNIGGVTAVFTVTTLLSETPEEFSFSPVTDVEQGSVQTSEVITIEGIDVAVPISIAGGEYRIDDGEYTTSAGTIEPGQSVQVRTTASDDYSATVEVLLRIGGGEGIFTVTTRADLVPATASYDIDLGIREDIVVTFDEPVDPATLELEGMLAELSGNPVWNEANTELRLSPIEGAWESGVQRLGGSVKDTAGNTTALDINFEIRLVFENFQEASVVIGQPDFTSGEENQGGIPGANTLSIPAKVTVFGDRLWVADLGNSRILGFDGVPTASNASASWVVGQEDFNSSVHGMSASRFTSPLAAYEHEDRLYVLDAENRIVIFDGIPLSPPAAASNVIGQLDLDSGGFGCSADRLDLPVDMHISDGKLMVAELRNARILVWNTVPRETNAEPAELVIGQESMTNCVFNDGDQDGSRDSPSARAIGGAPTVWSDGERLLVGDSNSRILLWNEFPQSNFEPADIVIGQASFQATAANDDDQDGTSDGQPSARTMKYDWLLNSFPHVWSNGLQIFVVDSGNNRVLIWNEFPTEHFRAADMVIGQSDFSRGAPNDDDQDGFQDASPSSRTFSLRVGPVMVHRDRMLVSDDRNNRVLVFEAR